MRGGFTVVESLVGAVILGFTAIAFFEGVAFFSRLSHENSELLTAEAVAWDAVWKTFNEPLENLEFVLSPPYEREFLQNLREEEAAQLCVYDAPPRLRLRVDALASGVATDELNDVWWSRDLVRISADIEWGDSRCRRLLSDFMEVPVVYRGGVRRAFPR